MIVALSITGCANDQPAAEVTPPTSSASSSQRPSATPATEPPIATPTPTRSPAATSATATQRPTLGKVSSYQRGFSYATGVLPEQWRSQTGWYALKGQGAEIFGDLAAIVERDATTNDQTLVVTTSGGEVLYQSPSLGLQQPQAVEPSLSRMRQNGK